MLSFAFIIIMYRIAGKPLQLLAMRSDRVQGSKHSKTERWDQYRLGVASWCGVADANHVEEECRHLQHSRLREQMSQEPLAKDGQRVQTDPDVYMLDNLTDVIQTRLCCDAVIRLIVHILLFSSHWSTDSSVDAMYSDDTLVPVLIRRRFKSPHGILCIFSGASLVLIRRAAVITRVSLRSVRRSQYWSAIKSGVSRRRSCNSLVPGEDERNATELRYFRRCYLNVNKVVKSRRSSTCDCGRESVKSNQRIEQYCILCRTIVLYYLFPYYP